MDKFLAISGIHVGEHSFDPPHLIKEFEARNVPDYSFLVVRPNTTPFDPEYFVEWARWCKEHRVYLMTLYTTQHAPEGQKSHLTPEVVAKMKEVAGEYFIGEQLGELGSIVGATPNGYHFYPHHIGMTQGKTDLRDCVDEFLARTRELTDINKELGVPHAVAVDATALLRYMLEGGSDLPLLETMPGDPEFLVSLVRGCAYAFDLPSWGTYIAHEWYGGFRNDDPLKYQRLKAVYNYVYLSGSHIVCLESGDEHLQSFAYDYPADHPFCKAYRAAAHEYENRLRTEPRPAAEPETRVAFVYGNLDAYTGWQGGCVWEQYDRPEWSYGPAEWSWHILETLRHGRSWQEVDNYGSEDLSAAPAYGLYDVIPATTDAAHLRKYETVIFVGWNSMTPEIYENLRQYVSEGGRVVMTAAHLNTNTTRDGRFLPIFDGNIESLAGCRLTGKMHTLNIGVKFLHDSMDDSILYPRVRNGQCDPILVNGAHEVCDIACTTADAVAVHHDKFQAPAGGEIPAVIENRVGKGVFTLITAPEYPGSNAIRPLYEMIVREQVTASHRRCPIHIKASDKLRFSVYRTEETDAVCLLNTDFTNPITVTAEGYGETKSVTLAPCESTWLRFARK